MGAGEDEEEQEEDGGRGFSSRGRHCGSGGVQVWEMGVGKLCAVAYLFKMHATRKGGKEMEGV